MLCPSSLLGHPQVTPAKHLHDPCSRSGSQASPFARPPDLEAPWGLTNRAHLPLWKLVSFLSRSRKVTSRSLWGPVSSCCPRHAKCIQFRREENNNNPGPCCTTWLISQNYIFNLHFLYFCRSFPFVLSQFPNPYGICVSMEGLQLCCYYLQIVLKCIQASLFFKP